MSKENKTPNKKEPQTTGHEWDGIKEYNTMDIDGLKSLAKQVKEQQEGGKKHFPLCPKVIPLSTALCKQALRPLYKQLGRLDSTGNRQ